MTHFRKLLFFIIASAIISGCASSPFSDKPSGEKKGADAAPSELERVFIKDIRTDLAGEKKNILIKASAPFKYITYMLEKPRRLAIEISGAQSALPTSSIMVDDNIIKHITALEFKEAGAVRIEIWLTRPMMYDLTEEKSDLAISLIPYEEKNDPAAMAERLILTHENVIRLKNRVAKLQEQLSELQRQYNIDENTIADLIEDLNAIGRLPKEADVVEEEKASEKATLSELLQATDVEEEVKAAEKVTASEPSKETDAAEEETTSEKNGDSYSAEISEMIGRWKSSWEDRDYETYSQFYTGTFFVKDMGLEQWLALKENKFQKAQNISVKIKDINVEVYGDRATAEFTQLYNSEQYNDKGVKTLMLVKTDDGWKIESETWRH